MTTFIEILLLIFIAGFLVLQSKATFISGLLGRRRRIILDSCALIDGRIASLARNGFMADELIIPQFIINELQLLADGNDSHKRERARFGLDIAHELQDASYASKVTIDRTVFPQTPATDDKLIQLAKKLEAYLYTTDYNLAKVASIEGVGILNVNELAQSLRPIALPGETLTLKIVQKGSGPGQGVGYLDDGTMIVVEGGARYSGRHPIEVVVTRMHQTVAGKMVFGQVKEAPAEPPRQQERKTPASQAAATVRAQLKQQPAQPGMQKKVAISSAPSASPAPVQKPKSRLHERLVSATQPATKATKPAPRRRPRIS